MPQSDDTALLEGRHHANGYENQPEISPAEKVSALTVLRHIKIQLRNMSVKFFEIVKIGSAVC